MSAPVTIPQRSGSPVENAQSEGLSGAREVPLVKSDRTAIVDASDFASVSSHSWWVNGQRYPVAKINGQAQAMHRYIMGAGPGDVLDHIDGNPLNNRRENLRFCTHAQNMKNRRTHNTNATGYKGVQPRDGGWLVCIHADGKRTYVGFFDDPIEAALAYDRAAKRLHGDFARLNFDPMRDWIFPYSAEPPRKRRPWKRLRNKSKNYANTEDYPADQ